MHGDLIPSRRSTRLHRYDYTQPGYYFFTICAADRTFLFGRIVGERMECNRAGEAIWEVWHELPTRFAAVELDAFVAMPNHVHGVLLLRPPNISTGAKAAGAASSAPTKPSRLRPSLGLVLRAFKSLSAAAVNRTLHKSGPVWQRNYHEHIVRNGEDLDGVRLYIAQNPAQWANDRDNPDVLL